MGQMALIMGRLAYRTPVLPPQSRLVRQASRGRGECSRKRAGALIRSSGTGGAAQPWLLLTNWPQVQAAWYGLPQVGRGRV